MHPIYQWQLCQVNPALNLCALWIISLNPLHWYIYKTLRALIEMVHMIQDSTCNHKERVILLSQTLIFQNGGETGGKLTKQTLFNQSSNFTKKQ